MNHPLINLRGLAALREVCGYAKERQCRVYASDDSDYSVVDKRVDTYS